MFIIRLSKKPLPYYTNQRGFQVYNCKGLPFIKAFQPVVFIKRPEKLNQNQTQLVLTKKKLSTWIVSGNAFGRLINFQKTKTSKAYTCSKDLVKDKKRFLRIYLANFT